MTKINIVGAGMSGLLCANMLRRHNVTVYEKQDKLPNNHSAVLRFRTPEVGNVLGVRFKKVTMLKAYVPHKNKVADSLSYSMKTTGMYRSDRSIIEGTVIAERYVAPEDLIKWMAENVNIKYGEDFFYDKSIPTISTIPMPTLMDLLGYECNVNFKYLSGIVLTGKVKHCDAYCSILFPGVEPFSRISITGDQLIIEFPNKNELDREYLNKLFLDLQEGLGINTFDITNLELKKQIYFKIVEIDDVVRKTFQRWATINYNVYSLGRFSTWRPKLLLDDLISDIKKIEGMILGGGKNEK